ncbi:hypothetical protein [Salmonella phage NINP13076]|nr:hypothetical protein [Salmonella phage NINP13076]
MSYLQVLDQIFDFKNVFFLSRKKFFSVVQVGSRSIFRNRDRIFSLSKKFSTGDFSIEVSKSKT